MHFQWVQCSKLGCFWSHGSFHLFGEACKCDRVLLMAYYCVSVSPAKLGQSRGEHKTKGGLRSVVTIYTLSCLGFSICDISMEVRAVFQQACLIWVTVVWLCALIKRSFPGIEMHKVPTLVFSPARKIKAVVSIAENKSHVFVGDTY